MGFKKAIVPKSSLSGKAPEGIEIIERHDHSNKVPYAKTGDDAAVAHGGYDFKFKNNNNYDLKILAKADKESVIITVNKIE